MLAKLGVRGSVLQRPLDPCLHDGDEIAVRCARRLADVLFPDS
jgi:hypothetical protein